MKQSEILAQKKKQAEEVIDTLTQEILSSLDERVTGTFNITIDTCTYTLIIKHRDDDSVSKLIIELRYANSTPMPDSNYYDSWTMIKTHKDSIIKQINQQINHWYQTQFDELDKLLK